MPKMYNIKAKKRKELGTSWENNGCDYILNYNRDNNYGYINGPSRKIEHIIRNVGMGDY